MGALKRGWGIFQGCFWPLLLVIVLLDLPPLLGEAISIERGFLADDEAKRVWGLLGVCLMPVSHGAALLLMQKAYDGLSLDLLSAFKGGVKVWGKYLVAYLYMSFLILGWVAVLCLPALLIMLIFKWKMVWLIAPFVLLGVVRAVMPLVFQEAYLVTLDKSPHEAREASRKLVKGRWGLVLKIAILTLTIPMALEFGVDLGLDFLGFRDWVLRTLLKAAFGTLAAFLYTLAAASYYALFRELAHGESLSAVATESTP